MLFLHPVMGRRSYEGVTALVITVVCLYLLVILSVVQIVGSSLLVSMKLASSVRYVWATVVLVAVWLFLDRREINAKIVTGHLLWYAGCTSPT